MNKKLVVPINPVIDYSVRNLCYKPYHNHKKGCPNFGKKDGCPPQAPYFDEYFDMDKPFYAICNIFDFKTHIDNMKRKQPNWSEHQLKCVLYWQNGARKHLKIHLIEFVREHMGMSLTACPEAMGVNITETMKNAGIELEWPPQNVAYQIAIAGTRKRPNQ